MDTKKTKIAQRLARGVKTVIAHEFNCTSAFVGQTIKKYDENPNRTFTPMQLEVIAAALDKAAENEKAMSVLSEKSKALAS